mgnify:CR=1 FL=1
MQAFPTLDELLLNPVTAAAAVVIVVNVISYALGTKPSWLAVAVGLIYMVGGYITTGRTAPDQLFTAIVFAFLAVAPLAHIDGAVLSKLFGQEKADLRFAGERDRSFFQKWI